MESWHEGWKVSDKEYDLLMIMPARDLGKVLFDCSFFGPQILYVARRSQ